MRHLVIGAGNMGRKHAKILADLGDTVDFADLEFKPGQHVTQYDSLLICTPAETHAPLIKALAQYRVPLFVEKPVFAEAEHLECPGISMVACNWRWCTCITTDGTNAITALYPQALPHDYIHFVDRFWHDQGQPRGWLAQQDPPRIVLSGPLGELSAHIASGPAADTCFNLEPLEHSCEMFAKQAVTWRRCVSGGDESPNPIAIAAERTSWLLGLLAL